MDLKGKRVVVTGASSGIGLELVKHLLKSACTVVAASRHMDKVKIKSKRLFTMNCDVSSPEEIDKLFEYAVSCMSEIDIFIANAGFAYYEKLETPNWIHIKDIFETNVYSVIYAAEKMKQIHGNEPYSVVCTASGMSFLSLPGYSLYSSTKAALRGFADAYRYDLEKGQNFQVVFPVATKTSFFKKAGNSPVPWPTQCVETVAKTIMEGIRRETKNIYPSKAFRMTMLLSRIFPFILSLYVQNENRRFRNYLKQGGKL